MSRLRWLGFLLAATSACSCSTMSKEKMLRLLFDDPPVGGASIPDSTQAEPRALEPDAPEAAFAMQPEGSFHPPYAEKDCGVCHALGLSKSFSREDAPPAETAPVGRDAGSRLILPVEDLCYECHAEMSPEALADEGVVIHAPLEGGVCIDCHDPHRARNSSLLRSGDTLEELCFECHDADDVLGVDPHSDLEPAERICTECHDPHASDTEKLLR